MTETHRDVPRHRGSLASQSTGQHHHRDPYAETRTNAAKTPPDPYRDYHDWRHRRGLPVNGGHIPGTQIGRGFCAVCGIKSGQHHHRQCDWTGRLP